MRNLISSAALDLLPNTPRVCLPYGIDLLDLGRWFNRTGTKGEGYEIFAGRKKIVWKGHDPISLFQLIRSECVSLQLSDSIVVSCFDKSVYFFDMHERFSFFSAGPDSIEVLFPFNLEIMWENFALGQEPDSELGLREIFDMVHSR